MKLYTQIIATELGDLLLATDQNQAVVCLEWRRQGNFPVTERLSRKGWDTSEDSSRGDHVIRQLRQYLAGERITFDLSLNPQGTPFQQQVWQALQAIPRGQTLSYAELAASIGKPTAFRGVGAANGANPISIIIPCHRVIGTNGKLTGYAGGLAAKARLLELEAVQHDPKKATSTA